MDGGLGGMASIDVRGNYVVGPGEHLVFGADSNPAYLLDGQYSFNHRISDPTFINDGNIELSSALSNVYLEGFMDDGYSFTDDSYIKNDLGATILVSAMGSGSTAVGYSGEGAPANVENDGTFTVSANARAEGVQLNYSNFWNIFNNTGDFEVSGSLAYAVDFRHGGTFQNSGTINVTGDNAYGVSFGNDFNGSSFTNTGDLTVTANSGGSSTAIAFAGGYMATLPIVINNSGVITAQTAILAITTGSPPQSPIVDLTNSGTINGAIFLGRGPEPPYGAAVGSQIHNTGAIHGATHFDNGDALYDGASGTQTGGIFLGAGTNTVFLGQDGETVVGGAGADTVVGGAGGDNLDGKLGTDTVSYAAAGSGVTVSLALTAAQNTVGAGMDTLANFEGLVGSGFGDHLTGDANANTLEGGQGDDVLDGGGGADSASYAAAPSGVTVSLAIAGPQNTLGAGTDTLISVEGLIGSGFGDRLTAAGAGSSLRGGGGDDVLIGGAGGDMVDGGAGLDTFSYALASAAVTVSLAAAGAQSTGGGGTDTLSSVESLIGSGFDDHLTGDGHDNTLEGGAGADVIDGGAGWDTASYVSATSGVKVSLLTSAGQNTLGAGTDTLISIENLIGSSFADLLTAAASGSGLSGGGGNDQLFGGAGSDVLDGGAGVDMVSYASAPSEVTVSLSVAGPQNTGGAGYDTLVSIEKLIGSAFSDHLSAGPGGSTLTGGSGNDILIGGAGSDVVDGGIGLDTASYSGAGAGVTVSLALGGPQDTGGAGTDTLVSIELLVGSDFADHLTAGTTASRISGGAGDDQIIGGQGDDAFDGGSGFDTVSYAAAGAGVVVDLSLAGPQNTGGAGVDTLTSIENLTGSAFADQLTSAVSGSALSGGAGNDLLAGWSGSDTFDGGQGVDAVSYAGAFAGVHVSLMAAGPQNTVGAGTDILVSIEKLIGSSFADTLTANATGATLNGGPGGDDLVGGPGSDILNGGGAADFADYALATAGVTVSLTASGFQNTIGAGSDELVSIEKLVGSSHDDHLTGDANANALYGTAGADVLIGGAGQDQLSGGAGNDTFVFGSMADSTVAAPDTILDLQAGDKIDLHLIDANTGLAGDQAFHLGATPGHAGDILVSPFSGGVTLLSLYIDGDANPDGIIALSGDHHAIAAGDFVL